MNISVLIMKTCDLFVMCAIKHFKKKLATHINVWFECDQCYQMYKKRGIFNSHNTEILNLIVIIKVKHHML